jgi:hypothetical protein
MMIVYSKANAAVLAAAEFADGDQIIDPPATSIFPLFNATYHAFFTKDSGNPADLVTNQALYQVDNIVSPTQVQLKNHVELILGTTFMNADGVTQQTATINVKDSTNNPVVAGFKNLVILVNGAFLQNNQAQFNGATSTFTLTAPLETKDVTIQVADATLDHVVPVPGLVPSPIQTIHMVPAQNVQSPLGSTQLAIDQVRTARVLFNGGAKFEEGCAFTALGTPSIVRETSGIFTEYDAALSVGAYAGIKSSWNQINGNSFRQMKTKFQTGLATSNVVQWIGMFNADPTNSMTPTNACGFRANAPGGDTTWQCYVHDGSGSQIHNTGLAIADTDPHQFKIVFDVVALTVTFYIDGSKAATFTVSGAVFTGDVGMGFGNFIYNNDGGSHQLQLSYLEFQYN